LLHRRAKIAKIANIWALTGEVRRATTKKKQNKNKTKTKKQKKREKGGFQQKK